MLASLPTALIAAFVPVLARIHATHIIGLALKTFIVVAIVAVLIIARPRRTPVRADGAAGGELPESDSAARRVDEKGPPVIALWCAG